MGADRKGFKKSPCFVTRWLREGSPVRHRSFDSPPPNESQQVTPPLQWQQQHWKWPLQCEAPGIFPTLYQVSFIGVVGGFHHRAEPLWVSNIYQASTSNKGALLRYSFCCGQQCGMVVSPWVGKKPKSFSNPMDSTNRGRRQNIEEKIILGPQYNHATGKPDPLCCS